MAEYHRLILHSRYRKEVETTVVRLPLTELTIFDIFGRGEDVNARNGAVGAFFGIHWGRHTTEPRVSFPCVEITPKVLPLQHCRYFKPSPEPDQAVPTELQGATRKTVAYAFDFILDALDYSRDEPSVTAGEVDLRLQPSADPMVKDKFCVVSCLE